MQDCRFVSFKGKVPVLGDETFVADTARIIGDVVMGPAVRACARGWKGGRAAKRHHR